jgi:hypothetical protein
MEAFVKADDLWMSRLCLGAIDILHRQIEGDFTVLSGQVLALTDDAAAEANIPHANPPTAISLHVARQERIFLLTSGSLRIPRSPPSTKTRLAESL